MKNRCLRTGDFSHAKHGDPDRAPEITTLLGMLKHPLNPSYTSVAKPKIKMLPKYGYALVEEELPKCELDDKLLVRQNEILQKKLQKGNELDLNANIIENNNIDEDFVNRKSRKSGKSLLNVDDMDSLDDSLCPGLATSAVTYKLE